MLVVRLVCVLIVLMVVLWCFMVYCFSNCFDLLFWGLRVLIVFVDLCDIVVNCCSLLIVTVTVSFGLLVIVALIMGLLLFG